MEDLTSTAAADNFKIHDALRIREEEENGVRAMEMVESFHQNLRKDTNVEVRKLKVCVEARDLGLDALR